MEPPEKQAMLRRLRLATNIALMPILAVHFYFLRRPPFHVFIESIAVAFVVVNVYYLIALKIWGSKSK
jgi:hypothetical protein